HLDLMKALLDRGADINARLGVRPWYRGFGNNSSPDQEGSTPFWRAALALDIDAMKLLVSRGADSKMMTKHGANALEAAAGMNHSHQGANEVPQARFDTVKYLVEQIGLDVNAKDDKGYTALHGAALIGLYD